MILIRKSLDRGESQLNWLSSFHTFSFAEYYDPQFMGFGSLRVINEDVVKSGFGFGRHPHKNMEIISYVVDGKLEHKDSMGNGSIIYPGEIQKMSAGLGVEHSEFNHSKTDPLHFLQIWIIPEKQNVVPSYQQIKISQTDNQLILIGSNHDKENVIKIDQNVSLYVAYMTPGHEIGYSLSSNRMAWLQLIKGQIQLNNHEMLAGDGAAIQGENVRILCNENAELLFFDLTVR